ncbi:MAG: thrombospondin type 3 repeat-containing protein, partial [Pseudomonadales bacterium]|nr:thrombospondin type 3 repeat-containing protein [Pseudomonadales bacterium]
PMIEGEVISLRWNFNFSNKKGIGVTRDALGLPSKFTAFSYSQPLAQQPVKIIPLNFHDPLFSGAGAASFRLGGFEPEITGQTLRVVTEEGDLDGDTVPDGSDNCPLNANVDQADSDGDYFGDACDALPADAGEWLDDDGDGIGNNADNCDGVVNNNQSDLDGDGTGDSCDSDIDGDGVDNALDSFPNDPEEFADDDGDGIGNQTDNCPFTASTDTSDPDLDGFGAPCDPSLSPAIIIDFDTAPDGSPLTKGNYDNQYQAVGLRTLRDSGPAGTFNQDDNRVAELRSSSSALSAPNVLRVHNRDGLWLQIVAPATAEPDIASRIEFTITSAQDTLDIVAYDAGGIPVSDPIITLTSLAPGWHVAIEGDASLISVVSSNAEIDNVILHTDDDNDGIANILDNCRWTANQDQQDDDNNGLGNACDIMPDVLAPVLNLPADIQEIVPGDSAVIQVNWIAEADDETDGQIPVQCSPGTGSLFTVGTTLISCSASDAAGNSSNGSFAVTVIDNTPPVLTLPDDITASAEANSAYATVSFTALASDAVDGTLPVNCDAASGSAFTVGTTLISCT